MRRFILGCLGMAALALLSCTGTARAEGIDGPETRSEARALWHHQHAAMSALTAWGAASMGAGATLMATETDDAFLFWGGLQHLLWGATNVVIGGASLYRTGHALPTDPKPPGYWAERARRMRRVFWINAALDVLYVSSAALLWGLAKPRAGQGSGAAIVMQGGFLLVFDVTAALTVP